MRPNRQLLAILVLALYAMASTLGVAFITCVEQDGSRSVEALGMRCCASSDASAPRARYDSSTAGATDTADCDACDDHRPAVDVNASRTAGARRPASPAPLPPHPPAPPNIFATMARALAALPATAPATRQPFAIPAPRSVVLRC